MRTAIHQQSGTFLRSHQVGRKLESFINILLLFPGWRRSKDMTTQTDFQDGLCVGEPGNMGMVGRQPFHEKVKHTDKKTESFRQKVLALGKIILAV